MATTTVSMKKGDTLPALKVQCSGGDDVPVDISGGVATFRMKLSGGGALKVNATATITDAPAGIVSYSWTASDTDTPGTYDAEFSLALVDGVRTFPSDADNIQIVITDTL